LQSLNLLNDEVFHEAAQALAWRIEREAPAALGERIEYAFRLAVGRTPSTAERQTLARYHDEQARIFQSEGSGMSTWVGVARVLLNLNEFVTRE
jgi:hypothetical protein